MYNENTNVGGISVTPHPTTPYPVLQNASGNQFTTQGQVNETKNAVQSQPQNQSNKSANVDTETSQAASHQSFLEKSEDYGDRKISRTYKLNKNILDLVDEKSREYCLDKADFVALAIYSVANKWTSKQFDKYIAEQKARKKIF